ncbi:MAG: hypothetical protein IJL80_01255 [Treponema sp.]|nr:hypothetical protein [Treponema sp.]
MTVIRHELASAAFFGAVLLGIALFIFVLGLRLLLGYFLPFQYDEEKLCFWKGKVPRKSTILYKDIVAVRHFKKEPQGPYEWAIDTKRKEIRDVPLPDNDDSRIKELIEVMKAGNPSINWIWK